MPPLGVSFHLLTQDQGLVLPAIVVPFDSNQFMLYPWAMSFFQKLCPTPFPPVRVGGVQSHLKSNFIPAIECLAGTNKTLWSPGPRERCSDPHERLNQICLCLRVSCGGTGQQWPAAGTGAPAAVVLRGAAGGANSPLGGGCH